MIQYSYRRDGVDRYNLIFYLSLLDVGGGVVVLYYTPHLAYTSLIYFLCENLLFYHPSQIDLARQALTRGSVKHGGHSEVIRDVITVKVGVVILYDIGLHSGTKKIDKLSKYNEDLSSNSVIFWIVVAS